jgi:hypothetical protein
MASKPPILSRTRAPSRQRTNLFVYSGTHKAFPIDPRSTRNCRFQIGAAADVGRLDGDAPVTIVRREHRAHFTILPNAIFLDERLSIEAKGVLGYLLSRPHKWSVRLEQIGWALRIGREKLQRIFRELISTGYVTREQQRMADDQRFGRVDYVVQDVPEAVTRSVDNCSEPRVQKGPAAHSAQVPAGANKSKLWPRVQKGPAYKELKNKKTEAAPDRDAA